MSMLPPPTPMLPRLNGGLPEESLLLSAVPVFDEDLTLDEADYLLPSSTAPTPRPTNPPPPIPSHNAHNQWDSPELGRASARDMTLDLDAYLPNAADATFLQDTSITSLPPPLSPLDSMAGSPYTRPASASSWTSGSTPGPSTYRKRGMSPALPVSVKRPRTPVEPTPHKDDFYCRRMSDASRRASFGTPSFKEAEREREDLRRRVSRESFRRAGSSASLASLGGEIEIGRGVERSYAQSEPQRTPRLSIGSLPSETPIAPSSTARFEESFSSEPNGITSYRSTPAKVIGFIAGLLGRSSSSSSLRKEAEAEVEAPEEAEEEVIGELEEEQDLQEAWPEEELAPSHALPVLSRVPVHTTINAPPLRLPSAPKTAYPYVPPLTRPQGPKFATDKRATRPVQKDAAPRPLAIKEQNKVIGTSAFARAALAKLPPPGKGSTAAGEKVRVRDMEHPKDFGGVRNVWERLAKENKGAEQPSAPREMKRTIPIQGHTPGKASLARAKEREAREAIRRERRAEMESQKGRR